MKQDFYESPEAITIFSHTMFGPKGPFCQSCGMPLSKDEQGGGTNADGSKNTEYCSKCYQKGQFTEPDITCEQMKEKVMGKMKEMHIPSFLAKSWVKKTCELGRWKKS